MTEPDQHDVPEDALAATERDSVRTDCHVPAPGARAIDSKGQHLFRAAIIGVVSGLIAVAFRWALAGGEALRGDLLAWLHGVPAAAWWAWTVLPCAGLGLGSLVGWAVQRYSKDAAGSGIPHLKGVLLHVRTLEWKALAPIKFVGGVLGISAGLSLGREGPTVQMGAAVGQSIAAILRVPSRTVPQLLTCGAGAGLAAAFNAPLAGFLFVIEELHRELSARTFAGALVAAIAADIVARALGGDLPSFAISGYAAIPLGALPLAALIGVLGGVLGTIFNKSLAYSPKNRATTPRIPAWMWPGIAAAGCGLIAWWLPEAVGGGHGTAERLLGGKLQLGLDSLALLMGAKFLLTVVSYRSGAPGGIFAPILLIGALAGSMVGTGMIRLAPSLHAHGTAFAILGMAALFAGSVRAPLTGIVLIIEMTGNYHQLLALGITCLIADLTAEVLGGRPIYEQLLERDLEDRPKRNDEGTLVTAPRTVYVGVQRNSRLDGCTIRGAGLPSGCLVVLVERAGREVFPAAALLLAPGDHLTIVVPESEPGKAIEVVRLATGL